MKKWLLHIFVLLSVPAAAQTKIVYLAAEMNEFHYLDDLSFVEMWGYGIVKPSGAYDATLPGPVLEFNLGDTVEIHFKNTTPEDHTIHLHGLDVSQEEDGVPMTSMAIDPGDSIVYNFVANNTGTFLYHCHVLTTLHLMMGMYGVIVVKNMPEQNLIYSGGPSFQTEHVFLASDMDQSVNGNPLSPGPFNQFVMDYFMINGLAGNTLLTSPANQVTAYPGDSVLLRLANIGYSKTRFIFPVELNAVSYLSDGRVLPAAMISDTLVIFPGERYEVLLTPNGVTDADIQVEYYESRNDQMQHVNFISVNGDIGVEEENAALFSVYPNPAGSQFVFQTAETGDELTVYDLAGNLVFKECIADPETLVNVDFLEKGIYLLRYKNDVLKFVKI